MTAGGEERRRQGGDALERLTERAEHERLTERAEHEQLSERGIGER
jgi:hypothetical protein